jgi:poly(A) polymerase
MKEFIISKRCVEILNDNGYVAYFVGGAVRDMLIWRTPKDFDIVTDAKIEDIVKLFPYKSHGKITEKFLVHAFMYEHCSVEIASFRDEGTIENRNSLPKYGTIKTDWLRRDFTMNSIYWNPISNEFIDPSGFGISDVKNRVL